MSSQEISVYRTGVLLAMGGALLWSVSGVLIKVLPQDPYVLNAMRCLIGGVVLLPMLRVKAIRFSIWLPILLVSYSYTQAGFVMGTRMTTAANAIALQSTAPVWVWLMLLPLHKGRPLRLLIPLAVITGGIGIMLMEPAQGTSQAGNLVALSTGVSFALVQIALARVHVPAISAVCLSNLTAGLVSLMLIPGGLESVSASGGEWLAVLFFGTGHSALAFVLFTMSLRRLPVTHVSVLAMVEPLLNPVWVYLATSEIPSVYGFIGWGGIMGGILLDALMRRGLKGSRKNREPGAEQTLDGAAGGELSPVSGGKSC